MKRMLKVGKHIHIAVDVKTKWHYTIDRSSAADASWPFSHHTKNSPFITEWVYTVKYCNFNFQNVFNADQLSGLLETGLARLYCKCLHIWTNTGRVFICLALRHRYEPGFYLFYFLVQFNLILHQIALLLCKLGLYLCTSDQWTEWGKKVSRA